MKQIKFIQFTNQFTISKIYFIIFASLIFGVIIGSGSVYWYYLQKNSDDTEVAIRQGGYQFINPLLFCDASENKQFEEYNPIQVKFKKYIQTHTTNGDASNISVYFRGLDSGHWSGVNENIPYSPASLLKVPLLIAYLKQADINPSILNKKIMYHQIIDANTIEYFKPRHAIEDGHSYSVEELLTYMIINSDNNAMTVLQNNVDQNSLIEVYSDLAISVSDDLSADSMTPKVYSYIFRALYNATYLSKPMSQYALELLAKADFPEGIKAGLPSSILSAQKFGERSVNTHNTSTAALTLSYRELHDCGIIYYPHNPYLLCIMTKGSDFTKLSTIISDMSSMVYQETLSGVLKI